MTCRFPNFVPNLLFLQIVSGLSTAPRATFRRAYDKPVEYNFAPNPFSYKPVYSAVLPSAPSAIVVSVPQPERVRN